MVLVYDQVLDDDRYAKIRRIEDFQKEISKFRLRFDSSVEYPYLIKERGIDIALIVILDGNPFNWHSQHLQK